MKGAMRFCKKGKLHPWYVRLYKISNRVGIVAYELDLPPKLLTVHPVFHLYMLKKLISYSSLTIPTYNVGIKYSLSFEEIVVQILDYKVCRLRIKEVVSVNVI